MARVLIFLRGGDRGMKKNTETTYMKAGPAGTLHYAEDTVTLRQAHHVYYIHLKIKEGVRFFFSGLETYWQQ